jgi:uncharacterized protein HemX
MNPTPSATAESNGQPVLQAEHAWLPSAESIAAAQRRAGRTPDAGSTSYEAAPRRGSRKRRAGFVLGGLAVAGALTVGVISDVGVRQSLDSSQKQLAASAAQLTQTNAKLSQANAAASDQTKQISDLHSTVASQQQQINATTAQQQPLTACVTATNTFFNDIERNDMKAANVDYKTAYTTCAVAGQPQR